MFHNHMQNLLLKEIIRFFITGGLSFLVDYGILVLLTDSFGLYYLVSSGISFSISVIINYMICFKWVFKGEKKKPTNSLVPFIGISLIGLFLNQFLMWIFVECISFSYKIAKIISTLLVIVWNYLMKRKAVLV